MPDCGDFLEIVSGKEINNHNATKANATRDNKYKKYTNKYIEQDPTKPTTTSMRKKIMRMNKQQVVAIMYSGKREYILSASRTFLRLIVLDCKRTRQSRQKSVVQFSQSCVKRRCV